MKANHYVSAAVALLLAASAEAGVEEAEQTLGFETVADWTAVTGITSLQLSTERTQGMHSLVVESSGYSVLRSRLLGPLGAVMNTLSLDLRLPTGPQQAPWSGAIQLFVSLPSHGYYNTFLGQHELTGLEAEQFHRLSFAVPEELHEVLSGDYSDLTFDIVLNVPGGSLEPYLIDNFAVTSMIPPHSTVALADRARILGFEDEDAWSVTQGAATPLGRSAASRTEGLFSMSFSASGYSVFTSKPMPTVGPVNETLTLDVMLPAEAVVQPWAGAVQLMFSIPSRGIYNLNLGQVELTGLPREEFVRIDFAVPPAIQAEFAAEYTDLRFSIVWNVPVDQSGVYRVDNLHIGAVTEPPAPLTRGKIERDLVGLTADGVVTVSVGDEGTNPQLRMGVIYAESPDRTCIPSETTGCRYIVHLVRVEVGAFNLGGQGFAGATLLNRSPFEVVVGGAGADSFAAAVPQHVVFDLVTSGGNPDILASFPAVSGSAVALTPAAGGFIGFSAGFSGRVDGVNFNFALNFVADQPLANLPPIADAGPDQSIVSQDCVVDVLLDGTGSSDANLAEPSRGMRWFVNDIYVGAGETLAVPVHSSGSHLVRLEVIDTFGSHALDEMVLNVTLAQECD